MPAGFLSASGSAHSLGAYTAQVRLGAYTMKLQGRLSYVPCGSLRDSHSTGQYSCQYRAHAQLLTCQSTGAGADAECMHDVQGCCTYTRSDHKQQHDQNSSSGSSRHTRQIDWLTFCVWCSPSVSLLRFLQPPNTSSSLDSTSLYEPGGEKGGGETRGRCGGGGRGEGRLCQ
jgi:hypothetical protein